MFVPNTTVALLSQTTKMPCKSWNLPAVRSCPSMVIGPNSICGACYAQKGNYTLPVVQKAMEARFQWAINASIHPDIGNEFVSILIFAIKQEADEQIANGAKHAYFRVHDSGDLFSPAYTDLWTRICGHLPDVHFWFPTRQWISKNVHMISALQKLSALPNVSVRPSALHFEASPPMIEGMAAGTSASTNEYTCPASQQGNKCRTCRKCWDDKDTPVIYHRKGAGKHKKKSDILELEMAA